MKTLLIATLAFAAAISTAQANNRSYDLRDVQPYPGTTPLECPYGTGYTNEQCSQHSAMRPYAGHSSAMHRPARDDAYKAMTAIENSHNEM